MMLKLIPLLLLAFTVSLISAHDESFSDDPYNRNYHGSLRVVVSRPHRSADHSTHRHPPSPVNIDWLTEEQHSQLEREDHDTLAQMQKIRHFYDQLPDDTPTKSSAAQKIVAQCYRWLPSVTTAEERQALKQLHHTDHNECKERVNEYIGRLGEEEQKELRKHWSFCEHVWYDSHTDHEGNSHHAHHSVPHHLAEERQPVVRVRRGEHTLDEMFKTHLSWLTDDQKEQLRTLKAEGKSRSDIRQKVLEFYEATTGETKTQATELLKGGCREVLKKVVGDEKAAEIKTMKESGVSMAQLQAKVDELLAEVTDEKKKAMVAEYGPACKKIFSQTEVAASRFRRDHHEGHDHGQHTLDDYFKTHLSWLNDEQKEQLKTMKAEGKSRTEMQQKVMEFYEAATGETKTQAAELLKGGCRELLAKVVGPEKAAEVKTMKESGASFTELSNKVDELLAAVTDEHKKEMAKEYGPACKKIFGQSATATAASRFRRDHHEGHEGHAHGEHTLDDYFKTHLSWLTDEQKETLKTMKAEGKGRTEIQQKILELYEATTGNTRTQASELLKGGCRELLTSIVGPEKAAELKALKENGSPINEIHKKVEELLAAVTDDHKKEVVKEYGPACKKIFGIGSTATASRRRRDHHEGHTHGGHTLDDYFKTHLSWLSDEQKEQLKGMKAEGKSRTEIQQKIMDFYESATGETKTQATELLKGGCRESFAYVVGAEKAAEMTKMKESGATVEEIHKKVEEMLNAVTDEHKKQVVKDYMPACKKIFGVGSQPAAAASRFRRDHHEGHDHGQHTLDDYFKTHLSWLNDEQKGQLKTMKAEGKSRTELQQKVMEFYEAATGETKTQAAELLKGGCRELLAKVVGPEKAAEVKTMKESGASFTELSSKVDELLAAVTDEHKKEMAKEYGPACKKIFGQSATAAASRRRRAQRDEEQQDEEDQTSQDRNRGRNNRDRDQEQEQEQDGRRDQDQGVGQDQDEERPRTRGGSRRNDYDLEHNLNNQYSWLTDEQKEQLRQDKERGEDEPSIQNKVLEFFHVSPDDVKEMARNLLSSGCEKLMGSVFGEEKAEELRRLRSQGEVQQLQERVQQYAGEIEDEDQRAQAMQYGSTCRKIFELLVRRRRSHRHHGY